MSNFGWIGVDFDATLVKYDGWKGPTNIGEPIPAMVARVQEWLKEGKEVRIFTARVWPLPGVTIKQRPREVKSIGDMGPGRFEDVEKSVDAIRQFCFVHFGRELDITCVKDTFMNVLWDDRCVQVEPNTGRRMV